MTLREAFALGKDLLKKANIEEYETDAWLLLEAAANCTRTDLFVRADNPLTEEQETLYQEYLEKQLKNFYYPHSLEIIECRCCKYLIEIVLQKDMHSLDHYVYKEKPNFYPFQEPRLLQCEVENGKICNFLKKP